jgi:Uma2 family endonuclease
VVALLPNIRSWTREEFHRAFDEGVFSNEERLELVDGQILQKMTHNPPHAVALRRISREFESRFGPDHDVRSQLPIALSERSEPEPDVVVVPGGPDDYLSGHPKPEQIQLLVEVSDASLDRDRRYKIPLYAEAGIKEVWIVDVEGRRLEAHREPFRRGYKRVLTLMDTESLAPVFCPGEPIEVSALLPPLLPDQS